MTIKEEEIQKGLDKAYKQAGHNAYFGGGFEAGVKFALDRVASAEPQLKAAEPQRWFMDKFDITAGRMGLVEHRGTDVVRFIYAYLADLP